MLGTRKLSPILLVIALAALPSAARAKTGLLADAGTREAICLTEIIGGGAVTLAVLIPKRFGVVPKLVVPTLWGTGMIACAYNEIATRHREMNFSMQMRFLLSALDVQENSDEAIKLRDALEDGETVEQIMARHNVRFSRRRISMEQPPARSPLDDSPEDPSAPPDSAGAR